MVSVTVWRVDAAPNAFDSLAINGSANRLMCDISGVRTVRDRAAATEVGAYSVIKLGGPLESVVPEITSIQ